jgi:hypothetical protein
MSVAGWLNTAWMLKAAPEAWAFDRATRGVAEIQGRLLAETLSFNEATDFGRRHRFGTMRDVRDYQRGVPLSRYEDYARAVERIAAGEQGVLTREPVELLEPTSGTIAGEKLIPYTAGLRRQFQRGIAAWVANLLWFRPALRRGRAYWSISPALGPPRRTSAGIPIGFEDDAAYLGRLEQCAIEHLLAVPSTVARLSDIETFRYCTLLCLLRCEALALISIWNPTFLTTLLAQLEIWQDRLAFDLQYGTVHAPGKVPNQVIRGLVLRPNHQRAATLQRIFRCSLSLPEKLKRVWPRLALISCWADAAAAHCLPRMRELFPGIEIQAKGLLATEGFVSIPLIEQPAPALAIRSHFFEFQEISSDAETGTCRLAHELGRGGRYRVILTTAGGLYRYELRDEIEVVGFANQCPLLRFLGKADFLSDLVGEKLAEPHVRAVLDRLFEEHLVRPRFALVVPVVATPPRYRLYLQSDSPDLAQTCLTSLARGLETGLRENPHYRYAVDLQQLAPAELHLLPANIGSGWSVVERGCIALGQRAGDIKPRSLDPWTGWPDAFQSFGLRHPTDQALTQSGVVEHGSATASNRGDGF